MSLRRICDVIVRRNLRPRGAVAGRFLATEPKDEVVDIAAADEQPVYVSDPKLEEELDRKRNKSRLSTRDRNILMGVRPYDEPMVWYHRTVRYKRRMLGKYGLSSVDVPAGFAWPTLKNVKDAQEYERVAFPLSLQERWEKLEETKRMKAEQAQAREAELIEKLSKMDQWAAELNAKVNKKKADLEAARLRKERLVEEVRKHFGFKISFNDERFKAMLEQKEKEEKKKKKEAKKKAKMDKFKDTNQDTPNDAGAGDAQEQATGTTKSVE
ncbi:PREDICTED: stress response protein nst1 [Vollenhovia emeryi]|uniref:stress response protein nst1 n=1 Tax=Vollenhovia emeryi TaxID=411798 RepID=UPI0005F43989|nr:PREDICTED: stress response protein nst1 [Vollenhovia emeryi]XP_011870395.1 PREDICTED: stress response protein nst1 [Vollenhovia emeryi]